MRRSSLFASHCKRNMSRRATPLSSNWRLQLEPLESRRCLSTLLLDDFNGGASAGVLNNVTFTDKTAVFRTHDDGIEYDASLFPAQGTIEVVVRVDEVGSLDKRTGGSGFRHVSTILDSAGADARVQGDIFLSVDGRDGRVRFTLVPVGGADPGSQVQVTSATSIVDGQYHSVAVSYGSRGIKLFIDGSLEDSDAFAGSRATNRPVSLGDFADKYYNDNAFANGFIGEVDAIRTSNRQSDATFTGGGPPIPGDANQDGAFDELDLIQVLDATKYLTVEPAVWGEGDWSGDGQFDQSDILAALQAGHYRTSTTGLLDGLGCPNSPTSIHLDTGSVQLRAADETHCTLTLHLTDDGVRTESGSINTLGKLVVTVRRQPNQDLNVPLPVYLTSSNPTLVEVPASVTIPAGEWSHSFELVIRPDQVGATDQRVTVHTVHPTTGVPGTLGGGGGGGGRVIYIPRIIYIFGLATWKGTSPSSSKEVWSAGIGLRTHIRCKQVRQQTHGVGA